MPGPSPHHSPHRLAELMRDDVYFLFSFLYMAVKSLQAIRKISTKVMVVARFKSLWPRRERETGERGNMGSHAGAWGPASSGRRRGRAGPGAVCGARMTLERGGRQRARARADAAAQGKLPDRLRPPGSPTRLCSVLALCMLALGSLATPPCSCCESSKILNHAYSLSCAAGS